MRKLFLLILSIVFSFLSYGEEKSKEQFFKGFDSYSALSFAVDDELSIKADQGIRLRFSNVTFVAGLGLPYEKCSVFPDLISDSSLFEVLVPRLGLSLNLAPSSLPFSAKLDFGTLGFSGALSRMKSPVFSIGSALSSPYTPLSGINSSLPGFSAGRRPLSFSLLLSPSGKSTPFPSLLVAFNQKKDFFLSIYKQFSLPKIPKLSLSLNGGFFSHSRDYNSLWFQKLRPYPENWYFCAEMEAAILWSHFEHWSAFSAVQSPYGGFDFWFRTSDSLILRDFAFNSAFFASTPGLITPSGSVPGTLMEMLLNPQFSFWVGESRLRVGFSALGEIDDKKSGEMKFRFDANIQNKVFKSGFTASSSFCTWDASQNLFGDFAIDFPRDFSSKLSASLKSKLLSPSASLSFKYGSSTQTIAAETSLSPESGFIKSISSDFSLSIKDGELSSTTISAEMELSKKWEKINVAGKISVKLKNCY